MTWSNPPVPTISMPDAATLADEISRLAELLDQGNRCYSCGNCERCWAIWAPRPLTVEEHARQLFARLKANPRPPEENE